MYCNAGLARMNPFSVSRRHTHVPFSKFVVYHHMISGFEQSVEHVFRGLHYDIRYVASVKMPSMDAFLQSWCWHTCLYQSCLIYDASWRLLLALGSIPNLQYVSGQDHC